MKEQETFAVRYVRKDLNGKKWVHQTKEFYFKDEAIYFKEKMEEKTGQQAYVYKKIVKYEFIC